MKLIKINLLPYREIREQKQKKQFQQLLMLGAIAGIAGASLIWTTLQGAVSHQNSRNESLQEGVQILDKELVEIKKLNEQKQYFFTRKQKVEELDIKRFEGARILDTLDQITPEGMYLTSITAAEGQSYVISGKAISDNKVALLMTALPSTGIFEQPELQSIKKGADSQEFSLIASLVEQKTATDNTSPMNTDASQPE